MLFQRSPTAFNRVVLAVIGRIVSQLDIHPVLVREFHQTKQKLCATTVALGTIVEIEYQRPYLGKAPPVLLPEGLQQIDQAIAGHLRGDMPDKQLIRGRQHKSHRRHQQRITAVDVSGFSPLQRPLASQFD